MFRTVREQMDARGLLSRLVSRSGQGTTEYAIIVGVIVVIAILAVSTFRGRIAELWSDISTAILGL